MYTLVSFVPEKIHEEKPGMFPGVFTLQPCKDPEHPVTLIVGDSVNPTYIDEDRGTMRVPILAATVAESVVKDYKSSKLAVRDGVAEPAFFHVEGEIKSDEVWANCKTQAEQALLKQREWFDLLVKMADDDWALHHQHKAIVPIQREAARWLGLEREWIAIVAFEDLPTCPMCKSEVRKGAVVCAVCRNVLDPIKFKEFQVA